MTTKIQRPSRISPEIVLLAAICLADLISTLWLIYVDGASEANPLMAFYVAKGPLAFALAKTIASLGPVAALEILRRRRPRTIRFVLRLGIISYLVVYCVGVWQVNTNTALAEATVQTSRGLRDG